MNNLNKEIVFSIIIPVYNVQNYLPRCLNSILRQGIDNIELILVDDGSTDDSLMICNEFAAKDIRIKTFHKENGGVSSARNFGIKQAKGNYILFVDADDFVTDVYFKVLSAIVGCGQQLVVFNYLIDKGNGFGFTFTRDFQEGTYSLDQLKDLREWSSYFDEYLSMIGYVVWNKVFRKDIIDKYTIQFDESMRYYEDANFIRDYIIHIKDIYICNNNLYIYNGINSNSSVRTNDINIFKYQIRDFLKSLKKLQCFCIQTNYQYDFTYQHIVSLSEQVIRLRKSLNRSSDVTMILNEVELLNYLDTLKPQKFYVKLLRFMICHRLYFVLRLCVKFKSILSNSEAICNLKYVQLNS